MDYWHDTTQAELLDAKDAFDVLLDGVRYGSFQRIRIDAQSGSQQYARF